MQFFFKQPAQKEGPISALEALSILEPALSKLTRTHKGLCYGLENIEFAERKYQDFYVIEAKLNNVATGNNTVKCKVSVLHRPWDESDSITGATFQIEENDVCFKLKI